MTALIGLLITLAIIALLYFGSSFSAPTEDGAATTQSMIEKDLQAVQQAKDVKALLESRDKANINQ